MDLAKRRFGWTENDDGERFFGCDTVLRLLLLSMR